MNKYPETSYALIRKNDNDNEIFTFRILIESNGTGHGVIETENNAWYSEGTVSYWRKPLELNCWHHIILTYDGHQTAIYLDGAIQEIGEKEISGEIINNSIPIQVGAVDDGIEAFVGQIRDIEFYDVALNNIDAIKLYHGYEIE